MLVLLLGSAMAFAVRWGTRFFPVARAHALRSADYALIVAGSLGLIFHCTAMFFPSETARLPLTDALAEAIVAFGSASIALYVVPAALVLLGLRRIPLLALAGVSVALVAVGVTMYNGTALNIHLSTIMAASFAISWAVASLTRPRPSAATASSE